MRFIGNLKCFQQDVELTLRVIVSIGDRLKGIFWVVRLAQLVRGVRTALGYAIQPCLHAGSKTWCTLVLGR